MILTRDKDRSPKRSQRFKTVVIPAHRITNKPTHLQLREGKHSKFFVKNSNEINKHSKWKNPWNTVNLEIKLHIGVLGKLKSFCEGKSSPIQMTRTKYTFPLSFNQEKTDHFLLKTIVWQVKLPKKNKTERWHLLRT